MLKNSSQVRVSLFQSTYLWVVVFSLLPHTLFLCIDPQVDVGNPDLEAFPEFQNAQYVECVLKEGEM